MGGLTNVDRAVEVLRQMIFEGDLPPGSDHLETELAARLNMSRTPVREAGLVLQAQGLVEMRPRRGLRVKPVSPEDMAEIYEILTELESRAAAHAAEAGYSAQDLDVLAQSIRDMDSALAEDDLRAWAEADDRFHRELVRLGGNARSAKIVAVMRDQVRRARSLTLFLRPKPLQSNADHARVYEAIATGDAETAHAVHHAHRRAAGDMLVGLLRAHALRNV